jgi:hypothetical protein
MRKDRFQSDRAGANIGHVPGGLEALSQPTQHFAFGYVLGYHDTPYGLFHRRSGARLQPHAKPSHTLTVAAVPEMKREDYGQA